GAKPQRRKTLPCQFCIQNADFRVVCPILPTTLSGTKLAHVQNMRRRELPFLVLFMILCSAVIGLSKGWDYIGPGIMLIQSIIPDRTNPKIVYTIVKSLDDYCSWTG